MVIDALGAASGAQTSKRALREAAKDLESAFLSEMLKHANFGAARESFGGGAGEDHFADVLVKEHARAMVEAGGIGLAESIFNSLVENTDESK